MHLPGRFRRRPVECLRRGGRSTRCQLSRPLPAGHHLAAPYIKDAILDDGNLMYMILRIAPSPELQRKLLIDKPERIFCADGQGMTQRRFSVPSTTA